MLELLFQDNDTEQINKKKTKTKCTTFLLVFMMARNEISKFYSKKTTAMAKKYVSLKQQKAEHTYTKILGPRTISFWSALQQLSDEYPTDCAI